MVMKVRMMMMMMMMKVMETESCCSLLIVLTSIIHPYDAFTSNMYGSLSHKGVTLLVSSSSSSRGFGANPLGIKVILWSFFLFGVTTDAGGGVSTSFCTTKGGVDVSVVMVGVVFFSDVLLVVILSSS